MTTDAPANIDRTTELATESPLDASTVETMWRLAKAAAGADITPKVFRNKPNDCFLAMAAGHELGLPPFQALQNIHVIEGRASLPGKLLGALIEGSDECVDYEVGVEGSGDDRVGFCETLKAGQERAKRSTFTWAEAKAAGLVVKDNWKKYPEDMLVWRAVARHARRYWAARTLGLPSVEEQRDIVDIERVPMRRVATPPADGPKKTDPLLEEPESVQPKPDPEPDEVPDPEPEALAAAEEQDAGVAVDPAGYDLETQVCPDCQRHREFGHADDCPGDPS